jgi:acyl carrier protein
VAEAVAVALGDAGDRYLAAYVVPTAGTPSPGTTALRDHVARELPGFMVPSAFVMLEALPLTPNGKLDRKALPAPDREHSALSSEFVAPETEVEQMLAEIWREVLEVERVGIYDSFFDLGGQSLKAMRVLSAVRDMFQVDLPVRALLEAPTIHGLAESIARALMAELDEETLAEVMAEMG